VPKVPWSAASSKVSSVLDPVTTGNHPCKPRGPLGPRRKLSKSSGNHPGISQTGSPLTGSPGLLIPVDFASDLGLGDRRRRSRRGADETLDRVLQGLLEGANRELASLLKDVHAGSDATLLDGVESGAIRDLLRRALRCATKQYMVQTELSNLALKDELTGLYNRRGFLALADRQLRLARRSDRSLLLFFIDLDGLKEINDVFGHAEGDAALKWTADALEATFRDSDLVARFGGDEFAALAIEASGQSEASIRERLTEYLNSVGRREHHYEFSVSVGTARFDPWNPITIRELIAEADQAMYEQKRRRSSQGLNNAACYQS
jgi:diguanylate cyclase (GGDEF)-like protein